MIFEKAQNRKTKLREEINKYYRIEEETCVKELLSDLEFDSKLSSKIECKARQLVEGVRKGRVGKGGIDAFMLQYELSSEEGIVLMCMAEALLRIPDSETADRLIRDKLGSGDWEEYLGQSHSPFVNASTWALLLTGKVVKYGSDSDSNLRSVFKRMINNTGKPIIRKAVYQAMSILGKQFVLGSNIKEATKRALQLEEKGYRYSYDMLGEAAKTKEDAAKYLTSYSEAINEISKKTKSKNLIESPSISIKLTALHPRFEYNQQDLIQDELMPIVKKLAYQAKECGVALTIDAEEATRLDITLDVLEELCNDEKLQGWSGLGLAMQAYQKRALKVVDWLADLSKRTKCKLNIRLVKGAYWDTEIKIAQENGLEEYPVFTRKANTDVSYMACAKKLIENRDLLYPQFATHNAQTVAAVYNLAGDNKGYEFQRLHGMGQALYNQIVSKDDLNIACRIYAPVGSHEDLLPYLVRRLLENGANSSFVNRLADDRAPIDDIISDPIDRVRKLSHKRHKMIPLPKNLYEKSWINSNGPDLSDDDVLLNIKSDFDQTLKQSFKVAPIINGQMAIREKSTPIYNPSNKKQKVGEVVNASKKQCLEAFEIAHANQKSWDETPVSERAKCLEKAAELLQERMNYFMAIAYAEAGKTLPDAVAEVREAIDFCRYYAAQAEKGFSKPINLPGVTGERNQLSLHGRGTFVCISPWNFPQAIFLGQIVAALVTGNSVIAKPAEQTPIIAFETIKLLHEAGIPKEVLHLLPGDGEVIGPVLIKHPYLSGVCFTGSTATAQVINKQLANRTTGIIPLIAETGGQNAMIVDSSALIEQVVTDVVRSSFQSAGQRCSALRVIYVQEDIAEKFTQMLKGAMNDLRIGDPIDLKNDIGPVIDRDALKILQSHSKVMHNEHDIVGEADLGDNAEKGYYFAPLAVRISGIDDLEEEIFGPVLHIATFRASDLKKVIESINNTGYGLTLGIHSRIQETVDFITKHAEVGNCYVNRDQIGAIVGCQPFGGEKLSGTGPKAGGPNYLFRFATERAVCIDVTAQGGNASLMSLEEIDFEDEQETKPPHCYIADRFEEIIEKDPTKEEESSSKKDSKKPEKSKK